MTARLLICAMALSLLLPLRAGAFPAKKVYEKTADSVVLIASKNQGRSSMIGAGSVISRSGLVVTNAHVVVEKESSKPYSEVNVFIKPADVTGDMKKDLINRHPAQVLAYDTSLDLAVLQVEGLKPKGQIYLADPADVNIGEEVVAIGHPEQGGLWTLTAGMISGVISDQSGVEGKDVYQTDTSVNRGNSGGPLLDGSGHMVGINTNIARVGSGNLAITGVNFAVQSAVVERWLKRQGIKVAIASSGKAEMQEESGTLSLKAKAEPLAAPESGQEETPHEKADKQSAEMKSAGPPADGEKEAAEKEVPLAEKEMVAPRRPYNYDDLLMAVERDLQDLKRSMKEKIRGR